MQTILELLAKRAEECAAECAFTYIEETGAERTVSFRELHRSALAVAARLAHTVGPGERVLLLYPQGIEYIAAFLGCLYARVVAVPLYPPTNRRHYGRIAAVVEDSAAAIALTSPALALAVTSKLTRLPVLSGDFASAAPAAIDAGAQPGDLAFLQYTSGSTGSPKGVMVSHANIIANLRALDETAHCSAQDVFCNWLPLFHDLGLINTVLLPIYLGAHSIVMSPARFMQRPLAWLEAISESRATIAGAPNFAFDHCVARITADQLRGIDLSSWRIAFNAAEPIDPRTLRRFVERFSKAGFSESAFYPAYGMAEATVFISAGEPAAAVVTRTYDAQALQTGRAETARVDGRTQELVGCGKPASGHCIRIVSPQTSSEVADGAIGEIWFAGPSVTQGYWNDVERTRAAFGARLPGDDREFLRTGDLGFVHDGELFVSGRIKDVLIVRGRNYYPQDLERTASAACAGLVPGGAIAFEIDGRVVLVQEVERAVQHGFDSAQAIRAMQTEIFDHFEIAPEDIVLIAAGRLPRTSSGKVQRALTRQRYLENDIDALCSLKELAPREGSARAAPASELERRLCALWQEVLGIERIGIDDSFLALGGHSLLASRLVARIRREWNCGITIRDLFEAQCIRELARVIAGSGDSRLPRITRSTQRDAAALSYMQQSLWLVDQIDAQKSQYIVSKAFRAQGNQIGRAHV